MQQKQDSLISEEQIILDRLIEDMDKAMLRLDKRMSSAELARKKAKGLPDAYGMLVQAEHDKKTIRSYQSALQQSRDELYHDRMVVDCTDASGTEEIELKVGLHTYMDGASAFIVSWKRPVCRHFLLDNASETFESIVQNRDGKSYHTFYSLKLRRKVEQDFDKIKKVFHIFPYEKNNEDEVLADAFLEKLLERRNEAEFRNIVFSIQKQQGQIIQSPFSQNMIVQGCAGSGKSMIMLHRLPILLYDHPNELTRNSLYIITPSATYIEMASKLLLELEIQDLPMGTLEDYYHHLIRKYGKDPDKVFKNKKYFLRETREFGNYVYSQQCIKDIIACIKTFITRKNVDIQPGLSYFHIGVDSRKVSSYSQYIVTRAALIQKILQADNNIFQRYYVTLNNAGKELSTFCRRITERKKEVLATITRRIESERKAKEKAESDILKLRESITRDSSKTDEAQSTSDRQARMIRGREMQIYQSDYRIESMNKLLKSIDSDQDYFELLSKCAREFHAVLEPFLSVQRADIRNNHRRLIEGIKGIDAVCNGYEAFLRTLRSIGDKYSQFTDPIEQSIAFYSPLIETLKKIERNHLDPDYSEALAEAAEDLNDLSNTIVDRIYSHLMKKAGVNSDQDNNDTPKMFRCSPFLYLQILFQFNGPPNRENEHLITIDEAQNIAPAELQLIQNVNRSSVVFNLFGDLRQHIAGRKGVSNWNEFSPVAVFKEFDMIENYRNARQITEYCNRRFDLKMRAINLDGSGVHELKSQEELIKVLDELFRKPMNSGLSSIIIGNPEEERAFLSLAGVFANRINSIVDVPGELLPSRWNIMTIEQAKGLEFETVIVLSGRMCENEKYIAYTRALDELFVFDLPLKMDNICSSGMDAEAKLYSANNEAEAIRQSTRRKRQKRT